MTPEEAQALLAKIDPKQVAADLKLVTEVDRRTCNVDQLRPAALAACDTCPWRRSNADSTDPLLDERSLARYWEGTRTGEPFACHKSIVLDAILDDDLREAGWKATPEDQAPRECAGAVAQVTKELQLRDELGSDAAYLTVRGDRAMTQRGLARARARHAVTRIPLNLEQYGRAWFPNPEGADSLPVVPPCFCPVCENHATLHPQAVVMRGDEPVEVDASLAPLLAALWDNGALTFASCESLRDAVTRAWPTELDRLEADPAYGHFVREGLAYIRGIDSPAWDGAADLVPDFPGGRVSIAGRGIQLAFPVESVPELAAATRECGP